MGTTTEVDEELVEGLRAAKSKRCYFVLVLKGGTSGALAVSKTKIAAPAIAATKKKSGGSAVILGFVVYEDGFYFFETAKLPSNTAADAVKTIVRRDAQQSIHAKFRLSGDPELATLGDGQAATTKATATAGQPTSPKSAMPGPLAEAAKYAAALTTWQQASAAALSAVDTLVSALEATGDEVAQAIASVIESLQSTFPDTLDDALTNLAKSAQAGNAADAELNRNKSEIAIKAALAYLNNNAKTIDGCEHNPFGISVAFRRRSPSAQASADPRQEIGWPAKPGCVVERRMPCAKHQGTIACPKEARQTHR